MLNYRYMHCPVCSNRGMKKVDSSTIVCLKCGIRDRAPNLLLANELKKLLKTKKSNIWEKRLKKSRIFGKLTLEKKMSKTEPKKFIAHFVGEGEGCDYTLACNEFTKSLEATTLDLAKREVEEILEDHGISDESERQISEVIIYEVAAEIPFNLDAWLEGKNQEREEEERKLTEKEELALLTKLQNKYGKKKE